MHETFFTDLLRQSGSLHESTMISFSCISFESQHRDSVDHVWPPMVMTSPNKDFSRCLFLCCHVGSNMVFLGVFLKFPRHTPSQTHIHHGVFGNPSRETWKGEFLWNEQCAWGLTWVSPRWFQVSTAICSQDCKSDLCGHIRGYRSISCCPKVWVVQQCLREMAHKGLRARTAWWCDVCSWCALLAWKGSKKVDVCSKFFPVRKEKKRGSFVRCFFDIRKSSPPTS